MPRLLALSRKFDLCKFLIKVDNMNNLGYPIKPLEKKIKQYITTNNIFFKKTVLYNKQKNGYKVKNIIQQTKKKNFKPAKMEVMYINGTKIVRNYFR
jgi:hypothetical protein